MQRKGRGGKRVDKAEEGLSQYTGAIRNKDGEDARFDKKYWNHRKKEKQADGEMSRFSNIEQFGD